MNFNIIPKKFIQKNAEIVYSQIPWDSEYLNNFTYEIYDIKGEIKAIEQCIKRFEDYIQFTKGDLLFVKIPILQNQLIQIYSNLGFYFMEQSVKPILELLKWDFNFTKDNRINIMKATESDIPEIVAIAQETFTTDRYHLDVNISSSLADYRYGKWVENSFKQNEDVQVCKYGEQILGFFVIKCIGKSAEIRLNGIKPDKKGKGLGKAMYISIISTLKDLGYEKVSSRISLNNLPVLNIYSSLGFKFHNPLIVLHKICNK